MRIKIIENFVLFFLSLIALALVYMQVIKGNFYFDQSVNNRIRVIPIEGPRGEILDSNGVVLADSHLSHQVAVVPQDMEDPDAVFNFLGNVLDKSPESLKKFFLHKRKTPFDPVVLAENINQKVIFAVQENRFLYPGLIVQESYERYYPFNHIDAHAIGYIGRIDASEAEVLQDYGYNFSSNVGKTGVERTYDSILRGETGGRQIEINSRGQETRLLGLKEPAAGKDIGLTIDERIQASADELLDSRPGSVIVMDLKSGDLLSLVSSPSFDPNAFIDKNKQDQIVSYIHNSKSPLLNRAVSGTFPPGSVFKIPLALAAIELHKVTTDLSFECPGYYMLGQKKFGCAHVHGKTDLNKAIAESCNVYFFHVGQIVTAHVLEQYVRAFGLGRPTGVDLPLEAKGQILGPRAGRSWYTGNTLNFSIGQGDTLTTPLQLIVMMAAVANKGLILHPRIVKEVDHKELPQTDLNKLPKVRLQDSTWEIIHQGLRSVVTDEEGTAHKLAGLTGMTIYGKTGTAQAGINKANHAWFVGYLHSSKSDLAFCVFLENGGGSANAVEITYQLLSRMQSQGII